MKRILHLIPHLSTGGCPQFAYDLLRKTKDTTDAWVVEYAFIAWDYVVQRNRIIDLMQDRFFSLGENKNQLFDIIDTIKPDVIHIQEFPEYFMEDEIARKLYSKNRNYVIVETSHDSGFEPANKRFFADHMALISQWQINKFKDYEIPITLLESDIEYKEKLPNQREQKLLELGLDPNKKHILNVGLWTSRKNQGEVLEYAKSLVNYPELEFHFVGNQAPNFEHYWKPLIMDLPPNVKIWGERSDVQNFYECMDLFLFTSRGTNGDMETSPLVLREATGNRMPILMYNLPVYLNYYDKFSNIDYLDFNNMEYNKSLIIKKLNMQNQQEITPSFRTEFEVKENKIFIFNDTPNQCSLSISIAELDTKHAIYNFDTVIHGNSGVWVIPIPSDARDNLLNKSKLFRGYEINIYKNDRKTLIQTDCVFYNPSCDAPNVTLFKTNPWNLTWFNYNEMFIEKIYEPISKMFDSSFKCFMDIGANDGLFIEWMLDKTKNSGDKYYAIECDPRAVNFLNSKFNSNKQVVVVNKAIWKENAQDLVLNQVGDTSTLSSLTVNKSGTVCVDSWDWKTLKSKYNIANIDFLKIDIEGAEYEVINSWDYDDIKEIKVFLIEYHHNTDNQLRQVLEKFYKWNYNIDVYHTSGTLQDPLNQLTEHGFFTAYKN